MPARRPLPARGTLLCLALTVLACGLRLYHLGNEDLWRDETVVYWLGNDSLARLWSSGLALTGTHPPLFYTLHHVWNAFLANIGQPPSEVTVRLPSVVLGTLCIPLWYWLVGRWFSERAAAAGAAFLVVSPAHIALSRDAKGEILVLFLLIVLLGCTLRLLAAMEAWSTDTAAARDRRMLPPAAGFVVSGLALLYAHSVGFVGLFVPSFMFLTLLASGRLRPACIAIWAAVNVVTILPFLPWLVLLHTIATHRVGYYWLPYINPAQALVETWQVLFDRDNLPAMLGRTPVPDIATLLPGIIVALVLLAGFLSGLWRGALRRGLMLSLLLLPVLIFALSRVVPIFLEYIVAMFALPLVAAAYGFAAELVVLPRLVTRSIPWARFPVGAAVIAAAIVLFFAPQDGHPDIRPNRQWSKVAALLAAHVQPQDLVLFWPAYAEWSVRFYWRPDDTGNWRAIDLGNHVEFRPLDTVAVAAAASVPGLAAHAARVWLVVDRLEHGAGDVDRVRQALRTMLPAVAETDFSDGLQVTAFQRR